MHGRWQTTKSDRLSHCDGNFLSLEGVQKSRRSSARGEPEAWLSSLKHVETFGCKLDHGCRISGPLLPVREFGYTAAEYRFAKTIDVADQLTAIQPRGEVRRA